MSHRRRSPALLPGLVALALAGGLALPLPTPAHAQDAQPQTEAQTQQVEPQAEASAEAPVYREHVLGDPDAPVQILEFSSFTCSHCAHFHQDSLPELKKRYIDTGKANLRIVDFPLDNVAGAVALMTRCAPDAAYQKMVDIYFGDPQAWMTRTPRESITGIARLAGMSNDEVEACFLNEGIYTEIMNRQAAAQERWNITGTPSFVINGVKHTGNYGVEDMSAAIDAALAKVSN